MRKVVVLGGGYGGVTFTKEFLKFVKRYRLGVKVFLVDRNEYHVLLPSLPECISDSDSGVLVKFSDIFKGFGENFEYIKGEVMSISTSEKVVVLDGGRELEYDDVVVALGAQPNDFGIPGVRENAIMFWNEKDTVAYLDKLRSFTERGISPRIVIVGAGPIGIEVASETVSYLKRFKLTPSITVVEAKSRVLPALPEGLSRSVAKFLEKRGIRLEYNCPICNVYEKSVVSSDGRTFEYDILVWSSGIKANDVNSKIYDSSVERGPQGKLVTDEFLRVKGVNNVWAIGDSCVIEKYGTNFTNLAQFAIQMSKFCAVNIVNSYLGKDLVPVKLVFKGLVIQLSKFKASAYIPKPFEIIIPPSIVGVFLRKYIDFSYVLRIGALGKTRSLREV